MQFLYTVCVSLTELQSCLHIPRSGLAQLEGGRVHCKNIVNSEVLTDTKLTCVTQSMIYRWSNTPLSIWQHYPVYVDVHIDWTCSINKCCEYDTILKTPVSVKLNNSSCLSFTVSRQYRCLWIFLLLSEWTHTCTHSHNQISKPCWHNHDVNLRVYNIHSLVISISRTCVHFCLLFVYHLQSPTVLFAHPTQWSCSTGGRMAALWEHCEQWSIHGH